MVVEKDTPVYMISIIAKIVGVHPQTLRFYENEGLVKPSRTKGKTRLYSEEDLNRVERIVSLTKDRGVNVAGTRLILALEDDLEQLFVTLSERLDDTTRELLISLLRSMEFKELNMEKILSILEE